MLGGGACYAFVICVLPINSGIAVARTSNTRSYPENNTYTDHMKDGGGGWKRKKMAGSLHYMYSLLWLLGIPCPQTKKPSIWVVETNMLARCNKFQFRFNFVSKLVW